MTRRVACVADDDAHDIGQIAAEQRTQNLRRITATLFVLGVAGFIGPVLLGSPRAAAVVLGTYALGQLIAFMLARARRNLAAAVLSYGCVLAQDISLVVVLQQLGPLPFVSTVIVLLAAATTTSVRLPWAFAATVAAIVVQWALAPSSSSADSTTVAAILFAALSFVVAMVHLLGIEQAFRIAQTQQTQKHHEAQRAKESEARYRLIADYTDDLVTLVDDQGTAIYLSPSHERLLGLEIPETYGRPLHESLPVKNVEVAAAAFSRTLEEGSAACELLVADTKGQIRRFESHMVRIPTATSVLVAVSSRDITKRRELEERLLASERLEALGRVAGGVAHDFNNVLMAISGAADWALQGSGEETAREAWTTVLEATDTGSRLTKQLLTFSKKQMVIRSRIVLLPLLRQLDGILRGLVGNRVKLRYALAEGVPDVYMAPTHVEQLVLNLVTNARDAMPQGGTVTLGLKERVLPGAHDSRLPAGEYAELSVTDEGIGIAPDVLPRLFDPFFTTKTASGTGLGLATCKAIVQEERGEITIETRLGQGTTFFVLLPAASAQQVETPLRRNAATLRRVLLVDDEASVRETTGRLLSAMGLQVLTASTLAEARQLLSDTADLDALLTDVVLGPERGTDLLELCRRKHPEAQIVVTSGYAPDPTASRLLELASAHFLAKPFSRTQLAAALFGAASPRRRPDR